MTAYRQPKTLVEVMQGLRSMGQGDQRAWARRLRDRELAGENLSPASREMWRAALNTAGPIFAQPITNDAQANERKQQLQRQADTYGRSEP